MKRFIFVAFMVLMMGCSQSSPTQDTAKIKAGAGTEPGVVQQAAQSPEDGTYFFDVEKYKAEQLKHSDSIFKKIKPQDLDRMMAVFRPFKIEVNGDTAKASFSHDVIVGTLKRLEKTNHATRLYMTPVDETKQDQTVTLIIDGDELVLDPGRKETDKMFFKKMLN